MPRGQLVGQILQNSFGMFVCVSTTSRPGSHIPHLKIVLRGFTCVQEFLRNKDTDYKLAKGAFIAAFCAELKDSCHAEANLAINEAENLAVEHEGPVLVGIFPTGGNRDGMADAVLRLQSSWVGGRVSYLLTSAAPFLGETRQLFTDRVRKPKGKGKGEGQHKGKGKPKGKGGKKGKGAAVPKRAAASSRAFLPSGFGPLGFLPCCFLSIDGSSMV